jgi:hypothetical protein
LHLYFRFMIDVFYPYYEREAKWEELRYSLRSVEKHLKLNYKVWIVGDLPGWIAPGSVMHIHHQRCEGMKENATYDAITKLLLFLNHPATAFHFIRMYDDMYLIGDVSLVDVGEIKAMYDLSGMPDRYGTWWEQLRKTLGVLKEQGFSTWNTETHFPELFYKPAMKEVIEHFDALNNRLLTSSLYYNSKYPEMTPILFPQMRGIQCYGKGDTKFYSSSDNIEEKCQGKIYLNHNNAGLDDKLKAFLMSRFPDKSRFER